MELETEISCTEDIAQDMASQSSMLPRIGKQTNKQTSTTNYRIILFKETGMGQGRLSKTYFGPKFYNKCSSQIKK